MFDYINLLIVLIEGILFIGVHNFLKKKVRFDSFTSISFSIITTLNINSLSALLTYFFGGVNFTYSNFGVMLSIITIIVMCVLIYTKSICKTKSICDNLNIKVFCIIGSLIFITLLFIANSEFMPIWGNVDSANHYYFINGFHQRLVSGNPVASNTAFFMPTGEMYPLEIDRYSYLFGFHFIVALISRIVKIETIYTYHIMSCIIYTLFIVSPILLFQGENQKRKIGLYLICMLFSLPTWEIIINAGWVAQTYSISLCLIMVYLLGKVVKEDVPYKCFFWFLLPLNIFGVMNSYILIGAMLLTWVIVLFVKSRKFKSLLVIILFNSLLLLLPSVYNQISNLISSRLGREEIVLDEALVVSYKSVPLSVIMITIIGIIFWIIYCKSKVFKYYDICLVWIIMTICILGIDNYTTYKTFITSVPLIFIMIIDNIEFIIWKYRIYSIKSIYLFYIIALIILALMRVIVVDLNIIGDSLPKKAMIQRGEYESIKYIYKNASNEIPIEYIGSNGPTNFLIYSITRRYPISSILLDSPREFVFLSETGYDNLNNTIFQETEIEKYQKSKWLIVEPEMNQFGNELYNAFFEINTPIFSDRGWNVKEMQVAEEVNVDTISIEDMYKTNAEQLVIKNIHTFGEGIISNSINSNNIVEIKLDKKIGVGEKIIELSGRVIHDALFEIELKLKNETVYKEEIGYYSGMYRVKLPVNLQFDEIIIRFNPRNISNSVIIRNIDIIYREEGK